MKESLGGNYKTSLIVTCSPHSYNLDEVVSSLLFAKRVKTIKNVVKVNVKYSYEELQKMIYLLNAKLKRALNGEKIDEENSNDKENGDNDFCSNCNLLKKEKKLLEDKIQNLLDTIQEKDLEIAKLKEMLGLPNNYDVLIKEKGKKNKKNKKYKKKDEKDEKNKNIKDGKNKTKEGNKKLGKGKSNNKNGEGNNSDESLESDDEETTEENENNNN